MTYCHLHNWWQREEYVVEEGDAGEWGELTLCGEHKFIESAQVNHMPDHGDHDDTSINGLRFTCSTPAHNDEGDVLYPGDGPDWGDWEEISSPMANHKVCAVRT